MAWIRWECGTPDSEVVGWLADRLKVQPATALGHYTAVCCKVGEHRGDGRVADVSDALLEQWALWRGRRGVFAAAFRERCQDPDGLLRGWWRQDKLDEKREKDRLRQQRFRASKSKQDNTDTQPVTRDMGVTDAVTSHKNPDAYGTNETDVTDGRDVETTEGQPDWLGEELDPEARLAFLALRKSHPRPWFFARLVRKYGPGGTAHRCSWAVLGQALLRFTGSNMTGTPGDPLLCKLIDAAKAAERPAVQLVSNDKGAMQPAVKQPDGSWRYLTDAEARALGWTGEAA